MTPLRLLLAATLLLVGVADAADVPKLERRVNDYAGVLQPNTRADLESSLKRYERETTHQIAVLTVPSLGGETIEVFSLRVANAWALGRKGVDNGVLVTLAPTEHQVRIELGNGMKRYVSDSDAKSIVEEVMIPSFRRGEYDIGLTRGIEKLFEACRAFEVRPAN